MVKRSSKTKKLTQEQLEYLRGQPSHRKKRLLKDPCWPSTESPECVKLMVKDNPWMLEKGGDKYSQKVVVKESSLDKEIKKKKTKKTKKQKGGALCVPCISPILSGLGVFGAGAAATGAVAAGVKGISMTKSKMSSSNGKIMREQHFDKVLKSHKKSSKKKTKRKENKLKFYIKQKNNVVTFKRNDEKKKKKVFNKSKDMKENIKKATEFYDKKIHYCVVKGYEKC